MSAKKSDKTPASAFAAHDHAACRKAGVEAARRICAAQGARLTPVRARALEILLESHRALGAYDLLERLRAEGFGGQPPVAYRALDFLVAQGLAHRVEKLNAFVACVRPEEGHAPAFMICRGCGAVAEARAEGSAIAAAASALDFAMERAVIEVEGLCPSCREPE